MLLKHNIFKRVTALFLVLVCVMGVLPLSAFAAGLSTAPSTITQKDCDYMYSGGKPVRYYSANATINSHGQPYVFDEQVNVPGYGTTRAFCSHQVGTLGREANGHLSSNGLYTTDDKGEIRISGIVGTVVAKEVKAAPGYVIDQATQTQTVVVRPEDTQTLVFLNEPLCSLTIKKVDSVTGKPIPNTSFAIKDGNGAVLATCTTGKDGTATVTGLLPNSTVVVVETKVPSGYVLNTTPQTITLKNGTNTVTSGSTGGNNLDFENDPETTLVIAKYVTGTTTPIKGVTFLVTDSSGAVIGSSNGEFITDENGRIVIEGLEPGTTVVAREIRAQEGYILDTTPKSIKIKVGGAQTLRFYNQKQGALVIRKLDSVTKKPLAGVEFQLTYADGSYVDADNGHLSSKGLYTTDRNGEIRLTGVVGTIVITETRCLDGYTMDEGTRTQTVKVNANDTQTITVYNTPVGGVEIIKVNADDHTQRIPNVTFEIRRMDGGLVDTITTGSDGRVHLPLEAGSYYAVETRCPKGYKLDNTPHYFTVKDGKTTTITVENKALCGITIHKTDSVTGKPIYGVTFLLYDADHNLLTQETTDNQGYAYFEGLTAGGGKGRGAAQGAQEQGQQNRINTDAGLFHVCFPP